MGHILWYILVYSLSLFPYLSHYLSLSLSVCGVRCGLCYSLSDESYLESYKLCSTLHSRYSRPPAHWYTTDCSQGLESGEGKVGKIGRHRDTKAIISLTIHHIGLLIKLS